MPMADKTNIVHEYRAIYRKKINFTSDEIPDHFEDLDDMVFYIYLIKITQRISSNIRGVACRIYPCD
jgi:6-phosphogluconate dehydrogenase